MRHLKAGRKLNRSPSHRLALMRNLARALILQVKNEKKERIVTTVAKAKEARRFVEKLITLARKAHRSSDLAVKLHYRRLALARLPDRDIVKVLFDILGPRFDDRKGGYTRVIKLHERRLGDAGETAILELLQEGETKQMKAKAAPIAPKVKDEDEEEEENQADEDESSEDDGDNEDEDSGGEDESEKASDEK